MDFTRDQIRSLVIESLREMLQQDGITDITDIDDDTEPIGDLGRDSPDGVEFACILSEKLSFHIPDAINPFVNDIRRRPRRVGQIVDVLCDLLAQQEEANHG